MLTFREFYQICEGKKPDTPPHAVPGTYQRSETGVQTYTLQRYDGPQGKPTKKEVNKLVVQRSGGKAVKKRLNKISKIEEDIETRRRELKQRQLDQMSSQRERVAGYHAAQQERKEKESEREELKRELKRELQTEQTPHMKPSEYNKQISQQSARWKGQQIRQSHDEMEREAYAQLSAKRQRLKTIMKR
jgi:hypothetical protein